MTKPVFLREVPARGGSQKCSCNENDRILAGSNAGYWVKTDGHNVQRSSTTKDLSTQRSDLVVCIQTVSVSTGTKGSGRRFSDLP